MKIFYAVVSLITAVIIGLVIGHSSEQTNFWKGREFGGLVYYDDLRGWDVPKIKLAEALVSETRKELTRLVDQENKLAGREKKVGSYIVLSWLALEAERKRPVLVMTLPHVPLEQPVVGLYMDEFAKRLLNNPTDLDDKFEWFAWDTKDAIQAEAKILSDKLLLRILYK